MVQSPPDACFLNTDLRLTALEPGVLSWPPGTTVWEPLEMRTVLFTKSREHCQSKTPANQHGHKLEGNSAGRTPAALAHWASISSSIEYVTLFPKVHSHCNIFIFKIIKHLSWVMSFPILYLTEVAKNSVCTHEDSEEGYVTFVAMGSSVGTSRFESWYFPSTRIMCFNPQRKQISGCRGGG